MEGTRRHLRAKEILVLRLRKLEKRQRTTVGQRKEQVAVNPLGSEQLVLLAPSRDQRKPDDVLIELPGRFQIARDVGGMVQSGRQFRGRRHETLLRSGSRSRGHNVAAVP